VSMAFSRVRNAARSCMDGLVRSLSRAWGVLGGIDTGGDMDYWTLLLLVALYYFTIFGPRVGERKLTVELELGSSLKLRNTHSQESIPVSFVLPLYFMSVEFTFVKSISYISTQAHVLEYQPQ